MSQFWKGVGGEGRVPSQKQVEVARYELRSFSFTVEETDGKHYLVVYRKIK